jgi:hypothetical protein
LRLAFGDLDGFAAATLLNVRRPVEIGLKARVNGMARPASVHNVTVTIDGVTHQGTYYVQGPLVYVQCDAGTKATQVGRSPPSAIAKLLLSELVREQRK